MTAQSTWLIVLVASGALSCVGAETLVETERPAQSAPDVDVEAPGGGVGSRVFVVERETESLAIYDLLERELLERRITGFGDMRHATMAFAPDLRTAFVATRSGQLSRIDLMTLERTGDVHTSESSIDIAISQDGRFVATAEYVPGGVTILDVRTLEVRSRIMTDGPRVTGIVDAPGNRFVCVLIEEPEIWLIDASGDVPEIERRIPITGGTPYDAMITPDGRWYVVGYRDSDSVAVLDLRHLDRGPRVVSIRDPSEQVESENPVKLPHMASWAVAGQRVFVPLVGQARLAVLDRETWELIDSIELRGNPVYAVSSPAEHEIWVSFSGEEDDAFVQIIDTEELDVIRTIEVGPRIYHMDFTPRGSHVLVTANAANRLVLIDANTYAIVDQEEVRSPSGVFGVWRAYRIGL